MERLLYVLGHLWEAKKIKDTLLMYMVGLQPSMSASIKLFPKQPWAALKVNVDMANHTIVPVFEVPMDIHPDEGLPEEQWQGFLECLAGCKSRLLQGYLACGCYGVH